MSYFIATVTTAFLSAYLSAYLATRRIFQEKQWKRKEYVYSKIIEKIYDALCFAKSEIRRYKKNNSSSNNNDLEARYYEAYSEIVKTIMIGSFVISKKGTSILDEMKKQLDGLKPETEGIKTRDFQKIREKEAKIYEETLTKIIEHAKQDLKRSEHSSLMIIFEKYILSNIFYKYRKL